MAEQEKHFAQLMEMFAKHGIPAIQPEQVQRSDSSWSFAVDGARGSIIIYRLWGPGVVNVWMGKADSDSGGLSIQGHLPHAMEHVLRLHKRFAASGRRKVLRRAERAPYGL